MKPIHPAPTVTIPQPHRPREFRFLSSVLPETFSPSVGAQAKRPARCERADSG